MKHIKNKRIKGRGPLCFSAFVESLSTLTNLFTYLLKTLSLLVPAFFILSCNGEEEEPVIHNVISELRLAGKSSAASEEGVTLDILTYNLDKLQRLDSYTRKNYGTSLPSKIDVSSRSGNKRVVILANWAQEDLEWGQINSLECLYNIMSDLASDNPGRPRMSGSATITAGTNPVSPVSMQTLSSRIKLNSICCDFTGRSYEGEVIKNAKVYLTNVCVSTSFSPDDNQGASYLNVGGLSKGELESFGAKNLIYREIQGDIGKEKRNPGISLYCYPFRWDGKEHAGSPQTKLVIEGEIGGRVYYYPVNIGEYTGGTLRRDTSYSIDLVITRLGATDQDTAISPDFFDVSIKVEPWEENESQTVDF